MSVMFGTDLVLAKNYRPCREYIAKDCKTMIYTINFCSESGSFTSSPTDVDHVRSLNEVRNMLDYWGQQHEAVGADRKDAYLNIYHGKHMDITDLYPDRIAYFGTRGGINLSPM